MRHVVSIPSKLARINFPHYGSLYLCEDVEEDESIKIDDAFAVRTITGRFWFDDRRSEVNVYRGPCKPPNLADDNQGQAQPTL